MTTNRPNRENADDAEVRKRQAAIERLRELRRPLPPGFKFDREEAHKLGCARERCAEEPRVEINY